MRALTIATLFPNNMQPVHGLFVKERIKALSELCELRVIAPIPFTPPVGGSKLPGRYRLYPHVKRREELEGLTVEHPRFLTIPKVFKSLDGFLFFASLLPEVVRIADVFPFDIIDVHIAYPEGFGAMLLAKFLKKPVALTVRGHDLNDFPRKRLKKLMIAYTLRGVDRVIAVCDDLREKAVKLGAPEGKAVTIPNGVDTAKFHPIDKIEARKELGLPVRGTVILSVGHLQKLKGFHHLIDAAALLRETVRDVLLIIVGGELHGDKSFRPQLERRVRKLGLEGHVKLVGAKPHHELFKWYSAADLFCLASSSEGWPNVIFEALACGRPVIATRVGGIPEIIRSEEHGILVERPDGPYFARAILNALEREWEEERMIEYARENGWGKVAERVYREFDEILNGYGTSRR